MKYIENKLSLDGVFFNDIFLKHSTPVYVYSKNAIHSNLESYMEKIDDGDLICFSVKSSNNLEILKTINSRGAGFDVYSSILSKIMEQSTNDIQIKLIMNKNIHFNKPNKKINWVNIGTI